MRCPARRRRRKAGPSRRTPWRRSQPTVRGSSSPRVYRPPRRSRRGGSAKAASVRARRPARRPPSSLASAISRVTNSDSGILSTTSPFTMRKPCPLPAAMPRSASRASPGPFTTQPMTATRIGAFRPSRSSASFTCFVSPSTSTSARPHDGQATRSSPRFRKPSDCRIAFPTLTSSTGIVRQRHTDRVADPLGEQRADPDRALHAAHRHRTGLGHAEVQRVVALLRELPIGLDHDARVRVLDRDLDVEEVLVLEDPRFVERATRPAPPGSAPRTSRAGPSRASRRSPRSGSARRGPSPRGRSGGPCRGT